MKVGENGLPSGECFVVLASEEVVAAALQRNRHIMGHRYVLVERSSVAELMWACPQAQLDPAAAAAAAALGGPRLAPPEAARPLSSYVSAATAAPPAPSPIAPGAPSPVGGRPNSGRGSHHPGGGDKAPGSKQAGSPAPTGGGGGGAASASGGSHGGGKGSHSAAGGGGGGSTTLKMRGLPYTATEADIVQFFSGLKIASGGVSIGHEASGRATGEAHVEFSSEADATSAMALHRQRMGSRYIELFRSKQMPSAARRPGSAAPTDSHAPASDCLRLRGLPFSCTEADVQTFFQG